MSEEQVIPLKGKYHVGGMHGYKAKPRTGNSSGPEKKRVKDPTGTPRGKAARAATVAHQQVMVVEALTGKRTFRLA